MKKNYLVKTPLTAFLVFLISTVSAQINWSNNGEAYYRIEQGEIAKYTLPDNTREVMIRKEQLTPEDAMVPLDLDWFQYSPDACKVLLFANTVKVWRLNTKGDYWVLDLKDGSLTKLGASLPESSLMFAKFSPDGKKVAYVSEYNLYVEDLTTQKI